MQHTSFFIVIIYKKIDLLLEFLSMEFLEKKIYTTLTVKR